jgi:glycosyltransferase involved in cell wall biosynthesis
MLILGQWLVVIQQNLLKRELLMMLDLSVIILSYNEEKHIERCIKNAKKFSDQIFLVDSFSTDDTIIKAKSLGAQVFQNTWNNNYAQQFNWGLDNLPIQTRWVLRLDADEYLSDALVSELQDKLPGIGSDISGIILNRKQYCFGTWVHPIELVRIFEFGRGRCEERWMDEHIVLSNGYETKFDQYFYDHNLNNFAWWISKHNGYSIREAIDLLDVELNLTGQPKVSSGMGKEASEKRMKKLKYAKAPLFWRSFAYFLYRYFVKLGFLKGNGQFIWDFFQGWWYRTLVDVKIYEIKSACGNDPIKINDFIFKNYGIKIS